MGYEVGQALSPTRPVVLVVEDEPLQRLMAIDLIEDAGFEAVAVSCADEAVRVLEARLDISVVFTDVDMPGGVDGMALAATVRNRWPPIELIIVSGRQVPKIDEIPARCLFFAKPYRRSEITHAMQCMVGWH